MPFVSGFLRARRGGHPDQGLPGGEGPTDPGYGVDEGGEIGIWPGVPDQGLPTPPPGIWPPLTPSHPIQPAPPGTPPGAIWPSPGHPSQGLPRPPVAGGGAPDQGLPRPPGAPDQGLPGRPGLPVGPDQGLPSKTFWVVAGIPGVGWRYVCVDPSLVVGYPIPPTAAPKA